MLRIALALWCLPLLIPAALGAGQPDLARLRESGFILGPGNGSYPIHEGWKNATAVMRNVDVFDAIADRVEQVVCGTDTNKSVLIIGDSGQAYKYLFARLANRPGGKCPRDMWHVDINVSKVESGHRYVGEVDEYWQQNVLAPSDGKDVVMYLQSVGSLVGIGSHANDDTGIEREYVANFTSGRMRTVGYTDKYEYNDIISSKHSYVMESFAEKIILPPLEPAAVRVLAEAYMATLYPQASLPGKELDYLMQSASFYLPNRQEPDRTLSVINQLLRGAPGGGQGKPVEFNEVVESKHPYDNNSNVSWTIHKPEVQFLQLNFESFDTEATYDTLEIYNAANNSLLERHSGTKGAFSTAFYPTNNLKLVLKSDSSGNRAGFKIKSVTGRKLEQVLFTHEDVRRAVMLTAQVPGWLIDRDYTVVKNLRAQLDGDVVGVTEGKKDLVRLARNGYVAGRTDEKPVASVLFTGSTGTGKSYIAKRMADFMGQRLITMDMTSYKDPSSFKTFQEVLANHLTNTPYAMYFFEEIDKASIEVLDQLYFMLDEGIFYDARQRPLFARGAFIMMTTNAASETILQHKDNPELRKLVMADLGKAFRASFLNRFDAISIFKPFTQAEFAQLAKTLLDKKAQKMKDQFGWTSTLNQGVYDYVAQFGQSPEFGARPMERLVEGVLGAGIAEYQLTHSYLPDDSKLNFTKLQPTHRFRLAVQGKKTVEYEVDSENNGFHGAGGRMLDELDVNYKLWKFFENERLY